jgi:hypothetical protein
MKMTGAISALPVFDFPFSVRFQLRGLTRRCNKTLDVGPQSSDHF